MDLIVYLLLLVVSGLVVGALGRLALPGPDPMSIPATIGIGLAASFVAGLIMYAIFGAAGGGLLVSVAIAAFFVYLIRRSRGQSVWSTRRREGGNPYRF